MPTNECSMLSICVPQNSYYFQNVRHIDNNCAVIKRTKTFQVWQHGTPGHKQVGSTSLYNAKLALLPGKNEFIVVGGSEDAECTRVSDKV